jgi:hypothetical protein
MTKRRKRSEKAPQLRREERVPNDTDLLEGPGFRMERNGRFIHQQVHRTPDEHRDIVTRLAASLDEQLATLAAQVSAMEAVLASVDSFMVLGAVCLANHLVDPEEYEEVSHTGKSFVAEYVALLALKRPYVTGTAVYCNGEMVQSLQSGAEDVLQASTWIQGARQARRLLATPPAGADAAPRDSPADVRAPDSFEDLQFAMRNHELGVRNMAYEVHHHAVLRGLFARAAADCDNALGCNVEDAVALSAAIVSRMSDAFNAELARGRAHCDEMKTQVAYARGKATRPSFLRDMAAAPDEDARETAQLLLALSKKPAKEVSRYLSYLTSESILLHADAICAFTPPQLSEYAKVPLERTEAFLRAFSLEFGSVSSSFSEPTQTHPLRARPLIHHQGRYLCPAPMLLDWAIQPRFEEALTEAGIKPWERYQRSRHDYLLDATLGLLQRMMPSAEITQKLLYDVGGVRGQEAELDAFAKLDSTAFLIEAKGMPMSDAALRGAPDSLRRDLRRIVGDSHAQAVRAKMEFLRLKDLGATARLRRSGKSDVIVEPNDIDDTILLSVTLAPLGHLTAQMPAESDAGIFQRNEYSWVVNLYDLMVIADLIDLPAMFPHYVTRRVHTARLGLLEASDELDLFMYYLKEGLYLDDLAADRDRGVGPNTVRLLSYTGPLDSYYLFAGGQRETAAPKPAQAVPPDLKALLERLAASKTRGWLEASLAILDLDAEGRRELAEGMERARRLARAEARASNVSIAGRGDGGWGITYWCDPDLDAIRPAVITYCESTRRSLNASRWIGIGEVVGGSDDRRVVAVAKSQGSAEAEGSRP